MKPSPHFRDCPCVRCHDRKAAYFAAKEQEQKFTENVSLLYMPVNFNASEEGDPNPNSKDALNKMLEVALTTPDNEARESPVKFGRASGKPTLATVSGPAEKMPAHHEVTSSVSTAVASAEGPHSSELAHGSEAKEPKEAIAEEPGLTEEQVALSKRYLKNRFLVVPGHAFPNLPCDQLEVIQNMGNQVNLLSLVCKSRVRQAGAAAAQKPPELL